jgi:hypothetical protein
MQEPKAVESRMRQSDALHLSGQVMSSLCASLALLLFVAACSKQPGKATKMSVDTSLGELVLFEELQRITDGDVKMVEAKPGELLVAIHFEGKNSFSMGADGILLRDLAGTKYLPAVMGSPVADGRISDKEWRMNGSMTARDGRFVFVGDITTPQAKQVFVYRIPATITALAFVDGDRLYPLKGAGFPANVEG